MSKCDYCEEKATLQVLSGFGPLGIIKRGGRRMSKYEENVCVKNNPKSKGW